MPTSSRAGVPAALALTCSAYLALACRPPPLPADQACPKPTPLAFAVAEVSFEFPDSAEVRLHIARDDDGDGAISTTELESLTQYTDARSPLGMALSGDADTVHVLYEDRLISADALTGALADVGLVAPALAGPVLDGQDLVYLTTAATLVAYAPASGETRELWASEGDLGDGALALASGGEPGVFLIADAEAGRVWRLDTSTGVRATFFDAPDDLVPHHALSYRAGLGLAWIAGGDQQGPLYWAAAADDGQLVDDAIEGLVEDPHCSFPSNVGVDWVGERVIWADSCLASVHLHSPGGTSETVPLSAGYPIAVSGAADPCQAELD